MALFNKGQAQPQEIVNVENQRTDAFDFKKSEEKMVRLAEKISAGNEKNTHLVQSQKLQLEQLHKEMADLTINRDTAMNYMNSGVRDQVTLKETAQRVELLNGQITDKKRKIDALELDIILLGQQKDEESINELFQEYSSYEKAMFEQCISPGHKATIEAKESYFTSLKKLREGYTAIERLAVNLNNSLGNADKVTVYKWFDTTINHPELLLTSHDEEKENVITHSYLAE
jgi:hypothetical protein